MSVTESAFVTVPFTNAITPGKKAFDVDINQVSISEERRKAVDFSTGYYDVAQAVSDCYLVANEPSFNHSGVAARPGGRQQRFGRFGALRKLLHDAIPQCQRPSRGGPRMFETRRQRKQGRCGIAGGIGQRAKTLRGGQCVAPGQQQERLAKAR